MPSWSVELSKKSISGLPRQASADTGTGENYIAECKMQ